MLMFSEHFGTRVRELLRETGLNADSIALLSEKRISHMTVRRMLRGEVPSTDLIIELVDALGSAQDWDLPRRAAVADDLLQFAQKRARYHVPSASVKPWADPSGVLVGVG